VTAELLVDRPDVRVYHAAWDALHETIVEQGGCLDALIVDAPYSARTHGAYRDMADVGRRSLAYAAWSPDDVSRFVAAWSPLVRGWFVTLTDHILAPAWEHALEEAGRYVFAPIACMEPGSRVRLSGDGPSQWSVWLIVARPRTREAQKWGALPGGYVIPTSNGWRGAPSAQGRSGVVGGKPLWLMERLVEDYSRPGDLVCDPCCGAGTTLEAALRTGRLAVGGDVLREHAELAAKRVDRGVQRPLFAGGER
jgi:hypothetical protein